MVNRPSLTHRDEPIDSIIAIEQLKLAYENLPNSFYTVPAAVMVLLFLEFTEPPLPDYLFIWAVAAFMITSVRFYHYQQFVKIKKSDFNFQRWANKYALGFFGAGIFWAFTPIILFPGNSLEHKLFISVIITGLATGVSFAYSSFLRPSQIYIFISIIPLILINALQANSVNYAVSVMLTLYTIILMSWLKNNNQFSYETLKSKFEKQQLADQLTKQNEKINSDNLILNATILKQKLTEKQLQEEEERFKLLTEFAQEGILISAKGKVIDSNTQLANFLGFKTAQEIIDLNVLDYVAPETREHVAKQIKISSATPYEGIFVTRNGQRHNFEAVGREIDHKGRRVRISVVRDITNRIKMEQDNLRLQSELMQKSKQASLGVLVAGIAHEINNPLAIINGDIDRLKRLATDLKADSNFFKILDQQKHAVSRAAKIVAEMLEFANPQTESIGQVDLHKLILQSVDTCQSEFQQLGITIAVSLQSENI